MKNVLIYIDSDAVKDSIDLLEVMEQMYGQEGSRSYGLYIGTPPVDDTLRSFDFLITVDDSHVGEHDVRNISGCIEELQSKYSFDAVLIPATIRGRMLAPRTAMRLNVGLVADVTAIRHNNEEIEMVRPAFSGRMLAGIVNLGRTPVMMSIRQDTFSYTPRNSEDPALTTFSPRTVVSSGVRLLERKEKPDAQDIRDSEVLISGGGGVLRYFAQLQDLAEALGGMVSASRKVVDSGAAPRHIQVGQSGRTVSPRLYIALGISGSIQHVVGLKSAEFIIAVNRDRHAPICSLSDIVVEGDAREFVDKMIKRIKEGGR